MNPAAEPATPEPGKSPVHVAVKFTVRRDGSTVHVIAAHADGAVVPLGTVTSRDDDNGTGTMLREYLDTEGFLIADRAVQDRMDEAVAAYDCAAAAHASVPASITVRELRP